MGLVVCVCAWGLLGVSHPGVVSSGESLGMLHSQRHRLMASETPHRLGVRPFILPPDAGLQVVEVHKRVEMQKKGRVRSAADGSVLW